MEADFASRYLVPQIVGPESLFVIVEREWSDRLKAGLEFRWFVPGAGRRLGPRGGV